ncbi:MAG TPA: LPS assembly lipoprotein LptE [Bryobacteraceae bacterium]|jgi:hypothetical protein|nr:LPS assembly lipoprotein LptE [Bryobacteraceae bacterium]
MKTWVLIFSAALAGCGYHTLNSAKALPESIHTIAVAPWSNATIQYKLSNRIAEAVSRELISRTHYTIVADPAKADAVLSGSVVNVLSNATVNDPVLNRSTAGQVTAYLQVRLIAKDGKVLFNRPNLEFRERFEIATTPGQYFDESEVALDRLSKDAARTVVSAILENF